MNFVLNAVPEDDLRLLIRAASFVRAEDCWQCFTKLRTVASGHWRTRHAGDADTLAELSSFKTIPQII